MQPDEVRAQDAVCVWPPMLARLATVGIPDSLLKNRIMITKSTSYCTAVSNKQHCRIGQHRVSVFSLTLVDGLRIALSPAWQRQSRAVEVLATTYERHAVDHFPSAW